jgi:hypothetical protein
MTRRAYITFDIDMTNYGLGKAVDELMDYVSSVSDVLDDCGKIRATWFVRIDKNIETAFGSPTHLFETYSRQLDNLKLRGHELGWHHHAYARGIADLGPEADPNVFLRELENNGRLARAAGLKLSRMGWGQLTQQGMQALVDLGFEIDSSAIPRPKYEWDTVPLKDWSRTPRHPYWPNEDDYQSANRAASSLVEVPLTIVPLPLATDTTSQVQRYVNLAYREEIFVQALQNFNGKQLVTVSHPYEFFPMERSSPNQTSIAFQLSTLQNNLSEVSHAGFTFGTLSELGGR